MTVEGQKVISTVKEVGSTAIGVAGAATTVLGATGGAAVVEAGLGIAAGTLAASVPVFGAVAGAILALGTAIAAALDQAFTDTFHPSPSDAAELLVIFNIDPQMIFASGGQTNMWGTPETVDKLQTFNDAARTIRYMRILAGEVKNGEKGNNGQLYNPVSNSSCDNPYMCRIDLDDPLTDPDHIKTLRKMHLANIKAVPKSEVKTPYMAQAMLGLIRKNPKVFSNVFNNWSQFAQQYDRNQFINEIKTLRVLAGEDGEDPVLKGVLRGSVAVKRDPGAAARMSPMERIGAGMVGAHVVINGMSGTIDHQGAFVMDAPKKASGPGEPDRTTGYLVLGGAAALTIGAFAALVWQERPREEKSWRST